MYNVYLHPNTDPIVDLELLTPRANCRIPLDQLSQGNLVVLLDRGAGSCRSYLVELLVVADHVGLNWRGRLDTMRIYVSYWAKGSCDGHIGHYVAAKSCNTGIYSYSSSR